MGTVVVMQFLPEFLGLFFFSRLCLLTTLCTQYKYSVLFPCHRSSINLPGPFFWIPKISKPRGRDQCSPNGVHSCPQTNGDGNLSCLALQKMAWLPTRDHAFNLLTKLVAEPTLSGNLIPSVAPQTQSVRVLQMKC